MWLDENTPLENQDHTLNTEKYFLGKVKIIGGQAVAADCYAVNNEGLLYYYDSECGSSATIPATVGGTQVKTIGSDAFKGTRLMQVYIDKYADSQVASPADFHRLTESYVTIYYNSSEWTLDGDYRIIGGPFLGSTIDNLTIKPAGNNTVFNSTYTIENTKISIFGPSTVGNLIIDSGITELGEGSCSLSTYTSVTLPDTLTTIGVRALNHFNAATVNWNS